MDSGNWILPLAQAAAAPEALVGGKAGNLARLSAAGFRVPQGFCITTAAYVAFLRAGDLGNFIRMELGRKPLASMRWEELWDTALRIRSAFLRAVVPPNLEKEIGDAVQRLGPQCPLAVRSSAPGEDSGGRSFAGLHESVVGVRGRAAVLDAVRVVWASLWSDAALLYRRELNLDIEHSRMAVLVQPLVDLRPSGVAFARDPRRPDADRAVVEAVPGRCGDLVDGQVDPDRWTVQRSSSAVLERRRGERSGGPQGEELLSESQLNGLVEVLRRVESLFGWPPDMEWTGKDEGLTVLQARPITTMVSRTADERSWYLALRPGDRRLEQLCERVTGSLIPALEAEGRRLHAQRLDDLPDDALADAVDERTAAVRKWRRIYREEFIPFAHGVRRLGTYYNDAVKPDDPYEFLGLLKGEKMLASERNRVLAELADEARGREDLLGLLRDAGPSLRDGEWRAFAGAAAQLPGGAGFARRLQAFVREHFDLAFQDERLGARPDIAIRAVLRLAQAGPQQARPRPSDASVSDLEQRLRNAVGDERRQEADEVLKLGRLSWRLRDDDNILLGRLEAQLLHSLEVASQRLSGDGRMTPGVAPAERLAEGLARCLRGETERVDVPVPEREGAELPAGHVGESPRQLVGQPAAPGLARGRVRVVRAASDLAEFEAGEVLVCDAIQPTMTHLVPLAAAIVERRGGMLIHGAIIARELGIPCVNGIRDALAIFQDGEVVAVDGDLGIVSIGEPELDLELR